MHPHLIKATAVIACTSKLRVFLLNAFIGFKTLVIGFVFVVFSIDSAV